MLGFYLTLIDDEGKSKFEELYIKYKQDMYSVAYSILHLASVIYVIIVSAMCFGMIASAENIVLFTLYTDYATSTLTILGTKATIQITKNN